MGRRLSARDQDAGAVAAATLVVVLSVAGCRHGGESTSDPPVSECAAATEIPKTLAEVRGAYGRMTSNSREGFPCELLLADGVAVKLCSPGRDIHWGEVRVSDAGVDVVLRFGLSGGTVSEAEDPSPEAIRFDSGANRMLLGTTCWGGPTRDEAFDRLATPLVGIWQRQGDGEAPRRLWIGAHEWRDLEGSGRGDVEVDRDPEGGFVLRRGEQSQRVEIAADRSRLTIDGVEYVHERAPRVDCEMGREVPVGQSVTIRLDGEDPDGGPVTWTLRHSGVPSGSALRATPDPIETTFVPDVPGEYSFLAHATDDEGSETYCDASVVARAAG